MPKVGMEPIRRKALVEATIAEISAAGSLDVTVSAISRRAGVSSGLAHHYFGGKEQIFQAAMRHILRVFGAEVAQRLADAPTPRGRLEAVIRASFWDTAFKPASVSAWLNLYVRAHSNAEALRLLRVYQSRLRSNLLHDLRPLCGARADDIACGIGALIDGLYIRAALGGAQETAHAADIVLSYLNAELKRQ
ncbi:transcriptional regulator BetI [uncultured Litoreibacter sp.]|uniref:choline-binding transcriptional repressor BetI n=1 Tax=uncultured Litoreibacter sp. TaxID=1392394 RepID=UPI002631F2AF|nr:transcriptional regulator BetI [uncultured Litoreibacter sp.]